MDWTVLYSELHGLIGDSSGRILWWQMIARGIIIFLFGLVLIRLFGRSAFGKRTALDIMLAIIVGSNLSRALTGNSPFLSTLAATTVLVLCFWIMDHIAARWRAFGWLVKGNPMPLFRSGEPDLVRMRRAGISRGDIEEAARRSGDGDLDDVDEAYLERSGKVSTINKSR